MKNVIGIVLVVLGVLMLVWTGFSFTKKEKIVSAGPVEISADKEKTVSWPPYAGGILLVGGVIILISGRKTR